MSQDIDSNEVERRVQRSFYRDGLMEIFLGLYLLLVGGMLNSPWPVGLVVLVIFLFKPAMEAVKKRLIYPRIGYVKFRPEKESSPRDIFAVVGILILILAGSVFGFVKVLGQDHGWTFWFYRFVPAYVGFIMAIGPVSTASRYGIKRWYLLGVLFVVSGVAIPFLNLESGYEAIALQCLLMGCTALFSGLVMFTRFIRTHPAEHDPGS